MTSQRGGTDVVAMAAEDLNVEGVPLLNTEGVTFDKPKGKAGLYKVGFLLVAIAAVVGTGYVMSSAPLAGHSEPKKAGPFSHGTYPDFVNYYAVPPPPPIEAGKPPVCDPEVVAFSCSTLNIETTPFYHNAAEQNQSLIHAIEIGEVLMVDRDPVVSLFQSLGLTNYDYGAKINMNRDAYANTSAGFAVSCQALCEALVASFPPEQLPTTSDVGCYRDPHNRSHTICDVDLSPSVLSNITFDRFDSYVEQHHYGENPSMVNTSRTAETQAELTEDDALNLLLQGHDPAKHLNNTVAEDLKLLTFSVPDVDDLKICILNLFRVWPATSATATEDEGRARMLTAEKRELSSNWRTMTLQNARTAVGYINQVLAKMDRRQIGHVVTKWFGNNNESPTRREIKRVLRSVVSMLNNVEYKYPGSDCQPNVYAYVYPEAPWNKENGKFVFHLCDYYITCPVGEQIETLTHEGSHHVASRTDDCNWQGTTMYGRPICTRVGSECARGNSDACSKALQNADTYCYFINDGAAAQVGSTSGASGGARRRRTGSARRRRTGSARRRRTPPPDRRRRSWFR